LEVILVYSEYVIRIASLLEIMLLFSIMLELDDSEISIAGCARLVILLPIVDWKIHRLQCEEQTHQQS